MKFLFALALALTAVPCFAGALPKKDAFRIPASESKLVFSLISPDVQDLRGAEAFEMYESLARVAKKLGSTDEKNYEEFALLEKSLAARGFVKQVKPLSGSVFGPAQLFEFYRKKNMEQKVDFDEPFQTVWLEFFYNQLYLDKGEKPGAFTPVPKVKLHGSIILHCPPGEKADCPISAITFHDSGIQWDLMNSARGANSSAGGANQK